jgi:DNA-binding transcriptional regulator GbsR (MarR family)
MFGTFQTEKTMAAQAPEFEHNGSGPSTLPGEAADQVKTEFIQDYGLGYQTFGLPKLMGQVVGLLLFHSRPISLDDITAELQVSKGPVSQIMRRLREHNLVRRIWVPGSRRDFYEAVPDIFGQAFANHAALQNENLALARKYTALTSAAPAMVPKSFGARMDEMERFYTMMNKHLANFRQEWQETRTD